MIADPGTYDRLTPAYRRAQTERVGRALARIVARERGPTPGRVVPDEGDLAIGAGRALHLAVLFLDVSGFSGRPSDDHDTQHVLLQVLNLFFSEMVRVAEDYGGTVEKNTGDGLMAYFEAGGAAGAGACQRAVAAALTMMDANDALIAPVLRAYGIPPVAFRVGIDHGPVTVARVGVARGFNANVAVGTAANLANKMLAAAGPGDVVLGARAAAQLPATWQQYIESLDRASGFVYVASGAPYPLFRYTGRWVAAAGAA